MTHLLVIWRVLKSLSRGQHSVPRDYVFPRSSSSVLGPVSGPNSPRPRGICTTPLLLVNYLGRTPRAPSLHLKYDPNRCYLQWHACGGTPLHIHVGTGNGAPPHATTPPATPPVQAAHAPMQPERPPSSAMLSLLQSLTLTLFNVASDFVYVLGFSFVTGLNFTDGGMRTAIAERMGGTILVKTYPNASTEDQVWRFKWVQLFCG